MSVKKKGLTEDFVGHGFLTEPFDVSDLESKDRQPLATPDVRSNSRKLPCRMTTLAHNLQRQCAPEPRTDAPIGGVLGKLAEQRPV